MKDTRSRLTAGLKAVGTTVAASAATVAVAAEETGKGGFGATATLGQLVEFQLTGLLVVFVVLGSLTVLCYLIGWILKTIAPDQYYGKAKVIHAAAPAPKPVAASPVVVAPTVTPAPATIHPGLSDEQLMAILAVAATEALGQAVQVVSFRPLGSMDWTWSIQGRVQHHTSHSL